MIYKNMFMRAGILIAFLVCCLLVPPYAFAAETMEDFSNCVIVTPAKSGPVEAKAITVLQEEIKKRTGIYITVQNTWPQDAKPVIAIGLLSDLKQFSGPFQGKLNGSKTLGAEGFALMTKTEPRKATIIIGKDPRGMLYGIGWLLRKSQLRENSILVPRNLIKVSTPKYWLRGHQLGYRPKTNAYDAWTPGQFDQYIRELALFGTNSIEICPPRTDDEYINKHMKVEPMEMMIRLSEILDSYDLDVWIWQPNMGKPLDPSHPSYPLQPPWDPSMGPDEHYVTEEGIQKELAEREEIFSKLKRIDHILVPGGDPGHLHPDQLFPWMERVAPLLKKYHPSAKIWLSPQAMNPTREWLSSFYKYVNKKPEWLGGVVFTPWVKTPIDQMRRIVRKDIEIRRYPDITHIIACQYPVRNWDLAWALTLHRECYNPRPLAMKAIHNAFDEFACGSVTYTEGIHDDINKFIWSDQDWDPDTEPLETMRDYCRLFISPDYADELAQGFMAQERNWQGPLVSNTQVRVVFEQWVTLEKIVSEKIKNNYRFQMGLLRAYYDEYVRQRLINETSLEMQAMEILGTATKTGSLKAMAKAEEILDKARTEPVVVEYKKKCELLSDLLFENIGSQLTVAKHAAQHRTRGAFMDGIDEPLNNIAWLKAQFRQIRPIKDEKIRIQKIDGIVNRTNPGPGGFYDNMGAHDSLKRIVNTTKWEDDPGTLLSSRISYYYKINLPEDRDIPLAWKNQASAIYETPLRIRYKDLDPNARYRIRVSYTGRRGKKVRLDADDVFKIHDLIDTRKPPIREFDIPGGATADGKLELTWSCGQVQRGSQISEIWLMKK
ncbi:MAG: alpha-glucuronidase family glycosyl hydrolase [Planctomycetota bacterium]|jgi:hypothetical protein